MLIPPAKSPHTPGARGVGISIDQCVGLQGRFYTLALIFVLYANILSFGLRLFTIDPFVSFLPATHRQYFILALSLPLRWLRVIFVLNTSIALKELFPGGQ